MTALTVAEVHHMAIRTEPHVAGQVPADVIGIVIDHNLVAVPQPVVHETEVVRATLK